MSHLQEKWAGLACIPVGFTILYYFLPSEFQHMLLVQFVPQISGYLCLLLWGCRNTGVVTRLGLDRKGGSLGLRWGTGVGLILGVVNTVVILWLVPLFGSDISFLKGTPHAKVPTWVMVPWVIMGVALCVELNFRGFLLGRLSEMGNQGVMGLGVFPTKANRLFAIVVSTLVFSFDPFMVTTFRHLHWIAVWDGMIWGIMWARWRNLYAVIMAHAVEVVILYLSVKNALT